MASIKLLITFCILILTATTTYQRPTQKLVDELEIPNPESGPYFEGDMMGVELDYSRGVPIIVTSSRSLWANGVVPYSITPDDYNSTQITQIENGLRFLENATKIGDRYCVRFIPRTSERNFVRVYNGGGCSSYIGKLTRPGEQTLSLKKPTPGSPGTCLTNAIIAHEFIHSLGLYHEQSRPDRDDFVRINWTNIQDGLESNFYRYTTTVDTLGFPYDYDSVMHYGPRDFGINSSTTLIAKIPGQTIGQRTRLSAIDIAEIRKFYSCN